MSALIAASKLDVKDSKMVSRLSELARSNDIDVQLKALQLIADLGPTADRLASQLLSLALSDAKGEIRQAAMNAFHAVGGGEAIRRHSSTKGRERIRSMRLTGVAK